MQPILSRDGGIGRHEGLKILWPVMAVRVQVPLAVLNKRQNFMSLLNGVLFFIFLRVRLRMFNIFCTFAAKLTKKNFYVLPSRVP